MVTESFSSSPLLKGTFREGPFVGLEFRTESVRGFTDDMGRFEYRSGEDVSFLIGELRLGQAKGNDEITLAELDQPEGAARRLDDPGVVNRARFVLSLSPERDLRGGVTIDSTVRECVNGHASGIRFDEDPVSFERAKPVRAVFDELALRFRGAAEARNHLRRAQAEISALRDVRVPVRDGSYLLADVFRPARAGRYPVLLRLGIYGRAFGMGAALSDSDYDESQAREAAWFEQDRSDIAAYLRYSESAVSPNASTWVPRGYVVVRVDGRGVGGVPGRLDPFSRQEARDYYDAIEWAAAQDWSDGSVGLYGGSYNATIQWNVAALRPPALKAIAPLASDGDAYRDLAYPGGIFLQKYREFWWQNLVGAARAADSDAVDFVGGLASQPWDTAYYHGQGLESADFDAIDTPLLTAVSQTGMVHARGGFEAFTQTSSPDRRLLVLDSDYMSYIYADCDADVAAFFDQHLKGVTPARRPPAVRIIMRTGDGGFEWREADDWPVPGTEYRTLYLDASDTDAWPGRLSATVAQNAGVASYSADAHAQAPRIPMAVFETDVLEEDLELAGHFRATLHVSSTSPDADLFVAVRVMDGEREVPYRTRELGSLAPLTWGCLKVSHRAIDAARSTAERPWHTHRQEDARLLSADEIVETQIELMAATGLVRAGCRLRFEVSPVEGPGAVPGFERAYDESYHREATNRVHTGQARASSVTIPVLT